MDQLRLGGGGSTFSIITEIMHTLKLIIMSVGLQCTYIISIHMCNNLFERVLSYVHIWQQGLGFREQYQRNHTHILFSVAALSLTRWGALSCLIQWVEMASTLMSASHN